MDYIRNKFSNGQWNRSFRLMWDGMVGKDSFMEQHISGGKHFLTVQIKKLVSLLTIRVSYEDTCLRPRL